MEHQVPAETTPQIRRACEPVRVYSYPFQASTVRPGYRRPALTVALRRMELLILAGE